MGTPDVAYVRQYEDSVTLLAQQLTSKLESTVMVDNNFRGEKKFYEQLAAGNFNEIVTRYADTPIDLPDHRRRMITPRYYVRSVLIDDKDQLQQLVDFAGPHMQTNKAGAERTIDDTIISAFGSTAYTGKEGTTTQAFSSANQIAVTYPTPPGATTGMTKAKVLQARKLLDDGDVGDDDMFAVGGPKQKSDLLNTTEVVSSDYASVKALVQGEINSWMGFQWKWSTRLLTNGSGHRLCYFWQKKGMQLAFQRRAEGRVTERPDKNYALQIYMRICLGATRLEEARVVEAACSEA